MTKNKTGKEQLINSLKKYGQTYEIHICKFGILDGYKRREALVDIAKPRIIDHPEVKTLKEYNEWIQDHLPIKLTPREKQNYTIKRAREFKKVGLSPGEYIPILAKFLQCSERQVRRYLPDSLKDQLQQERKSGGQMSTVSLIPLPPKNYSFLDGPLWAVAYRRLGKDKLLELLDKVANHYSKIKKTADLDANEKEKVLAEAYEEIITNESKFQELLGRYEEKHPSRRVKVEEIGTRYS